MFYPAKPLCALGLSRHSLRSAWSRGPLRPLRGSAFGLGQPDDFVAGASPYGSRPPSRGGYAPLRAPHPAFQCSDAPCTFLRAFPAMPLWRVVVINSNLSNPICKVAKNKNAIVQRLLDVLHKPFQAAVNRSTIWLAKCDNDNPCVDRVQ